MSDKREDIPEVHSEMLEEQLGPSDAGLAPIPEPQTWEILYGLDEATAIAVVPERALIFWELARVIQSGIEKDVKFSLVRMRLDGEQPSREKSWPVGPVGRFQDSGLEPGKEYIWAVSRVTDGKETPLLVTNPVRMPIRTLSSEISGPLPSSIELLKNRIVNGTGQGGGK